MSKLRIAALGSSFAAGPGIEPIEDSNAMRSSRNYAHLVAEKLDADLTDLSASGATLQNVLSTTQNFLFSTFPPQLNRLPPDTDIVTLTAGGNDLGYSSGMIQDSLAGLTGPLQSAFETSLTSETIDIPTLQARLGAVIDKIKEIAPKAKVYLVEYINVFGECTRPKQDIPLTREKIEQYVHQAQRMSGAYQKAAEGRDGVEVIPMSELSKGHEVGSEAPWITGFSALQLLQGKLVPYHPNAEGHRAVAEALLERISRKPE